MKLYLRITYGWIEAGRSIEKLEHALSEALAHFGFKPTGSSLDLMVRDLSFEADEFECPGKATK